MRHGLSRVQPHQTVSGYVISTDSSHECVTKSSFTHYVTMMFLTCTATLEFGGHGLCIVVVSCFVLGRLAVICMTYVENLCRLRPALGLAFSQFRTAELVYNLSLKPGVLVTLY